MILNRLVTTEGNTLQFHIRHTVNGEEYKLADGERYYMAVAKESEPDRVLLTYSTPYNDIDAAHRLEEGKYVFELSVGDDSFRQVIMPALDDKNKPLSQIIVLRRISDE